MAELDEISRVQGRKWGGGGARRAHLIPRVHQAVLGTYIDPIRIQYARARPNFWSARRSAAIFLVRAVATLCRLARADIKFLYCFMLQAKVVILEVLLRDIELPSEVHISQRVFAGKHPRNSIDYENSVVYSLFLARGYSTDFALSPVHCA